MRGLRGMVGVWACVCLVLAVVATPPAFAGPQAAGDNVAPTVSKNAPALADRKERLSYALGMVLGSQYRDQSVDVDPEMHLRGLKDALAGGTTLLTDKEARALVNALQGELKRKQAVRKAPGAIAGIEVTFRMDPRITRSMYMGDRWISPPTFQAGAEEGKALTVDARVHGVDAKGNKLKIKPEWIPSDPEMVTVTPGAGGDAKIEVKRAGTSTLKVAAPGASRVLSVKATGEGSALRVEITQ